VTFHREQTKGGHQRILPIPAPLMPILEAAMRESPSDIVFPNADGEMMSPENDLVPILRRAMARAG
jgi:hypothetical protein